MDGRLTISGDLAVKLLVAAGVGLAAYLVYRRVNATGAQLAAAVSDVLSKDLNPASPENLVYRSVNAGVQAATGDKDATLGTALYSWLHPLEDYQITGDPATLPWYARAAGYGAQAGFRLSRAIDAGDVQISDIQGA